MRIVKGDFLVALGDPQAVVAAPTNGVVGARGLVMGAGAAKALAEAEPRLPRLFAEAARREGTFRGGVYLYGFVAVEVDGNSYGAFQTKAHFRDRADLGLVHLGASRLRRFLEERPGLEVHMAFPGIGLGGLSPRAVLEALERGLGDQAGRVVLYRLPKEEEGDQPPPLGPTPVHPRQGGQAPRAREGGVPRVGAPPPREG